MALPRGTYTSRHGIRSYFPAGVQSCGADNSDEALSIIDALLGVVNALGGEGQLSGTALSTGTNVAAGEWIILDDSGYPHYRKTTGNTAITFGSGASQDLYAILTLQAGVSPDLVDESLTGISFTAVAAGGAAPANHSLKLGTGGVTGSSFTSFTYADGVKLHDDLRDLLPRVVFTIGAEGSNEISVTVQFEDWAGADLTERCVAFCWLGDTAYAAETGDVPSGGWTATTGTLVSTQTTNASGWFMTDANGTMVIKLTETGADTWYLHVQVGARVYASGAITFT